MSVHKIICGDIIPALKALPDEGVDMLMTSVPYWGLRDYGEDTATIWGGDKDCEHDFSKEIKITHHKKGETNLGKEGWYKEEDAISNNGGQFCSKCGAWRGQLGLEPTPELYIEHLRMVFAEVKRVLKKTGTCWVNIGDTYNSNSGFSRATNGWEREGRGGGSADKNEYADLPAKCMCLIPERFLIMMVFDLGYILRNKNVWKKDNPMPSSVKNRFNNVWEPVYFFTKNNKPVYFYNDKTDAMVNKKPTSQIEGVDWDWKTCPFCDGTGVIKKNEYTLAKWCEGELKIRFGEPCNRCKTTGRIKANYWHSVDYWFDLDAVREEHKTPLKERESFNYRVREAKKGHFGIIGVKSHEEEMVQYNTKGKHGVIRQSWAEETGQSKSYHGVGYQDNGKNPGDVFVINTEPYPDAHFATFATKLVGKPLLAGCPAEVCKHCGMARVRITKQGDLIPDDPKYTPRGQYHGKEVHSGMSPAGMDKPHPNFHYEKETIGWTDCQCEDKNKYEPGIIIDIFGGSGTVGIVAEKHGRSSILIDIKRDYCEMAFKRLKPLVGQTKLTGEQSTIERTGF